MSLVVTAESLPLATDAEGVVRIAGTRVTLDTVVSAFLDGATPEAIAEQYPAVSLGDAYTALGYCLRHRQEVTSYLQARQQQARQVRQEAEERWDPAGIRARLSARRGQG